MGVNMLRPTRPVVRGRTPFKGCETESLFYANDSFADQRQKKNVSDESSGRVHTTPNLRF